MTVVYVLDKNGEMLMPTQRFGKVRKWLRDGQAKVYRREPFTIKLLFENENRMLQEEELEEIKQEWEAKLKESKRKKKAAKKEKAKQLNGEKPVYKKKKKRHRRTEFLNKKSSKKDAGSKM